MSRHDEPILLLGASGRLGRILRSAWPASAPPLHALSRAGGPGLQAWSPGDSIDALPRVGSVVALWGVVPGATRSLSENAALASAAMDLGAQLGANRVLHASSAAVYRPGAHALSELEPADPVSAYGSAKRDMERAARTWRGGAGPQAVCLRIGNVAGAESLFGAMAGQDHVTLDRFPDGQGPRRSYLATTDLARAIAALATAPQEDLPDLVNLAAPRPTAMADIARAAGREVRWREAPPSAVPLVALDTARLETVIALGDAAAEPVHLVEDARRHAGFQ
ncbi:NAD-dependent epimerase/dehydratase family protein [Litorisediminicola beolgyonensis]|uniref:NAD-dependent epimerase/dehydratase family protein n=1 Tax=Litorisediminicola beolgyonensis TaxID=1173614 RepID=A0ABW3ZHJ4_9RHOB